MKKQRPEGTCHLCGKDGTLSYEHVPPAAAFNRKPVVETPIEEAFNQAFDALPRGKINQQGAGAYTLYERCNNNTGSWYGGAFADWCYQDAEVLTRSGFKPKLIYLHYVFPLRILKQILTMCFSTNSPRWREKHPELEAFILDRERRWLNPQYRVFVSYNVEGTYRRIGNTVAMVNLNKGTNVVQVAEISHPPFGYVMTYDGTCPDRRLFDITHFRRYAFEEFEVAPLYLPVLPTHLPLPLDYRTKSEIEDQVQKSLHYESA